MTTEQTTQASRKTAVIVGVLFIVGTVAGVLSGLVNMPLLDAPDYLAQVAAHERVIVLGALLVLVMGFPLAMVPVMMFPIFKQHNEYLALGAIIFRGVLEAVAYIIIALLLLQLIPLGQGFVAASGSDTAVYHALAEMVRQGSCRTGHILALVFSIGALMPSWLFYRTRLIPRWLALWGLVGALLSSAAPITNIQVGLSDGAAGDSGNGFRAVADQSRPKPVHAHGRSRPVGRQNSLTRGPCCALQTLDIQPPTRLTTC